MDCKNALAETDGDIQAPSKSYVRKARQWPPSVKTATQPKDARSLRPSPVSAQSQPLKCETDFVAKNESFRALTKTILDAAVAASAKSLDEVKAPRWTAALLKSSSPTKSARPARRWSWAHTNG